MTFVTWKQSCSGFSGQIEFLGAEIVCIFRPLKLKNSCALSKLIFSIAHEMTKYFDQIILFYLYKLHLNVSR